MKTLKIFVAAVASMMALACTQEEIEVLTMGSTELNIPYQGAEQTLEFSTNASWTIESDKDWVTFDVEEGAAGDAEVVMTVAANTTYEARTAVVTIAAGQLFTEYVIKQGYALELSADMEVNLDFKSQVFEIELNTNLDYEVSLSEGAAEWITSDALTKAAPAKETLAFNVAMNTGEARSAVIYITAEGFSQTVLVKQGPIEPIDMTSVEATYLGKTSWIYDSANWVYPEFDEYYLSFANEAGDKLTLSLVAAMTGAMTVPSGVYAAGTPYAPGTITINDGSLTYYTSAIVDGNTLSIVDGSVSVSVVGENHKVVADLVDETGMSYGFTFVGKIPEMTDKSFGVNASASFGGQYNTYFTTKANKWSVTFYISKKAEGSDVYVRYLNIDFYSAENVDQTVLPEGGYAFAVPENDTTMTYANGTLLAQPGMMTYLYGSDGEGNTVDPKEGSKVVVTKNADGTYTFTLVLKCANWKYDDDYNRVDLPDFDYAAEFKNVEIGEIPLGSSLPTPDKDDVFTTVGNAQYVGLWWGDIYGTGGSVYTMGFSGAAANNVYEVYLTLHQDAPYTYEKNFLNRFCNTPFEDGVYAFSRTVESGKKALLPVTDPAYSYIKNNYTGTKMLITAGSITLGDDKIEYNLEATAGDKVYKFTGSHAATLYYAQDYSKKSNKPEIVTE